MPALLIAALIAVFPWQPAAAQAAVPCTAISDDEERLACYDRALRAASPAAPAPAAPPAQAPAPPAEQTPAAQERAAPATRTPAAPAARAPTAQRENGDEAISIVIVGVRTLPGRETTFTAQDGSIWVQTDSQRVVGLPETPFEADLKPGAMGSRFLVPMGRGRAIRVRRSQP